MLKGVPQLAALGPVFKTCPPVQVRRWGRGWGTAAWVPSSVLGGCVGGEHVAHPRMCLIACEHFNLPLPCS